jgi:hypothetical protein
MAYSIGKPINLIATATGRAKHGSTAWLMIGSALLAIAPKCPICFLAYLGVFGVASTTASQYRAWIPPLTIFSLTLTVSALGFRAHGKHRFAPALMGLIAAVLILVGKFVVENQAVIILALAVLMTAAVWRVFNQRRAPSPSCSPCEGLGTHSNQLS